MSLEILNNKGSSDLFSSKLLSENDVENGLLSKQNFFNKNTFDEISAFKDSPFGQYWQKQLPSYAIADYGPSRVLRESNFSIVDLSKRFSSALASLYNKSIDENWDDIKFVVYANPDGSKVLKQYADPNFKPEDNQVMFLIETNDGKFDFGKIVRVKLGKNAIEKLKFQYPFLGQTDEEDLAIEFLNRSFEIKNNSSLEFSEANKERKLNTKELKDLLVKAIKYDYKQKKFDDMSLFLILLQGEEFLGLNTPKKILELSQWMRTKKYDEEKFWNALLEKDFTPAFLPNVLVPQNRKDIKEAIKNKFKQQIDSISKSNNNDVIIEKIFKEILNNVLLYLFDKFSSLLDEGLKILDELLPESEMLNEIYNLNAFLVGLWNGCIEFVAGIVDLVSLVMIIARDGIGFALTDSLEEAFESLLNEIFYNFEDFIKKLWEKFRITIKEFPDWYLKYGSNQYYQYKELGELTPDIITLLVPAAKAGKASKVAEEISLLKNLSKTEKELAIEKRTQEYLESYYEAFRKESKNFSKELEEKTVETEIKEGFDNSEIDLNNKIPKTKEIEELTLKRKKTPKEEKVFLKKINLDIFLKNYADDALIKWKNPNLRPGAVGILEGEINGKTYQVISYSSKNLTKKQIIERRHKLVQEWLSEIADEELRKRPTHGKCAEPICVSEFLFETERQLGMKANTLKIDEARKILIKTKSKAVRIDNIKEPLIHGLHKKACASCNPMLKYFNITEIH
jgi:hypothetical protein